MSTEHTEATAVPLCCACPRPLSISISISVSISFVHAHAHAHVSSPCPCPCPCPCTVCWCHDPIIIDNESMSGVHATTATTDHNRLSMSRMGHSVVGGSPYTPASWPLVHRMITPKKCAGKGCPLSELPPPARRAASARVWRAGISPNPRAGESPDLLTRMPAGNRGPRPGCW